MLIAIQLKNKTVILPAKVSLFGNSKGIATWDKQAIEKATGKSNKEEPYFTEKRKGLGRVVCKEKSEFRVMTDSQ